MSGPTALNPKVWLKADAGAYNDAGSTLAAGGETATRPIRSSPPQEG